MTQTVTVLSVREGKAEVVYDRPTACHNDCAHCAGGCGSTVAHEKITVTAENPIGAMPGDQVVIEAAGTQIYGAILLVYALPIALFFPGYFLGQALGLSGALTGVLGFFLGVAAAVATGRAMARRGREIRFRITSYAK